MYWGKVCLLNVMYYLLVFLLSSNYLLLGFETETMCITAFWKCCVRTCLRYISHGFVKEIPKHNKLYTYNVCLTLPNAIVDNIMLHKSTPPIFMLYISTILVLWIWIYLVFFDPNVLQVLLDCFQCNLRLVPLNYFQTIS